MRVLLHIGSTKTGSSAFQAYCYRQRGRLLGHGILYPETGVVDSAHHLLAAAVHPGVWKLHNAFFEAQGKSRLAVFKEMAGEIERDARRAACDTILISSEYLWGELPDDFYAAWAEKFAFAEIEVAAVLRRPDRWVQSKYLQAVKYGEKRSFDDWYAHAKQNPTGGFDYYEVLKRWSRVARSGEVSVIAYQDLVSRPGFCVHLLETIVGQSFTQRALREDNPVSNPSPERATLELLLAVNRSDIPSDKQKAIRHALMQQAGSRRAVGQELALIPASQRAAILREYGDQLAEIVEQFNTQRDVLYPEAHVD